MGISALGVKPPDSAADCEEENGFVEVLRSVSVPLVDLVSLRALIRDSRSVSHFYFDGHSMVHNNVNVVGNKRTAVTSGYWAK